MKIEAPALGAQDKVFVTAVSATSQPLFIEQKTAGSGFAVSVVEMATTDIHFDWWIVGVETTNDQAPMTPPSPTASDGQSNDQNTGVNDQAPMTNDQQSTTNDQ